MISNFSTSQCNECERMISTEDELTFGGVAR